MKPLWFEKVGIEDLPEPFRSVTEEMAEAIRSMVTSRVKAEEIALVCVKTMWGTFEGTEPYWHQFQGDKFCQSRHAAIRSNFRKEKLAGTFELRNFLDRWNITERTLRSIVNGDHEDQEEMFPEEE